MAFRTVPERFMVAFSGASGNRSLVRSVAEEVQRRLGQPSVFYDEWYDHYLTGTDADLKLENIYAERSDLLVVCVGGRRDDSEPRAATEDRAIARAVSGPADSDQDLSRVLMVRVDDGDQRIISHTAILPDIRSRTVEETAQLIVDRLNYVISRHAAGEGSTDWPHEVPVLSWPIANHAETYHAISNLLARSSEARLLTVRGPAESGKSFISRQMSRVAVDAIPSLRCGRLDFKGASDIDAELDAFALSLQVVSTHGSGPSSRFTVILNELKQDSRPTFLIFDTYESAQEAENWIEHVLFPMLVSAPWLRVAVFGQMVPPIRGTVWESIAAPPIALGSPSPEDWLEYAQMWGLPAELDFITAAHRLSRGRPAILASLLGPRP